MATNKVCKLVAEYVWLDVNNKYRSKTRTCTCIMPNKINGIHGNISHILNPQIYPEWNYDGSSTGDVIPCDENNHNTECILQPVRAYIDPFNMNNNVSSNNVSGNNITDTDISDTNIIYVIVWCINYIYVNANAPTSTNDPTIKKYIHPEHENMIKRNAYWEKMEEPMFGFEQEFFVIDKQSQYPVGFAPCKTKNAFETIYAFLYHSLTKKQNWGNYIWDFNKQCYFAPVAGGQGPYYCGNGTGYNPKFREFINDTYKKMLTMGLKITGMNYEVAPGQAEFQICDYGISACDGLHMLRWVLIRNAEAYNYMISFEPVVIPGGKYNNTGCHLNFSTKNMRAPDGIKYIHKFIDSLSTLYENTYNNGFITPSTYESLFGIGNCKRLSGKLETSPWHLFTAGIGTRHTSIRIPNSVASNGCGYLEDRRPGGNVSPYKIANYYFDLLECCKLQEENYETD